MKFSIKDFFSKCNQIRSFLRIWSHLLKKSLMENFIFSAVMEQWLYGWITNLAVSWSKRSGDFQSTQPSEVNKMSTRNSLGLPRSSF